jgi:MEMO1 family protein
MQSVSAKTMIRRPAVAGQFYPESPESLTFEIDTFLEEALVETPPGDPIALIVPHAGYVFSGWVAAYAYKTLIGKKFDTVILIGLCHRGLKGIALYDRGRFTTPLGDIEVNSEMAKQIMDFAPDIIQFYPEAHAHEHSIEVQLPFLQRTLQNFKIVPILIDEPELSSKLSQAIVHAIHKGKEKTLLIGSTDLTHYPKYEDAKKVDNATIEAILSLNSDKLDKVNQNWLTKDIPNLHCALCSEAAIKTVIYVANQLGANRATLLKSANSGDIPIGDKYQVVGYAAISITRKNTDSNQTLKHNETEPDAAAYAPENFLLDDSAKKELLHIARRTLTGCVQGQDVSEIIYSHPKLKQHMGAFVTLHDGDELRGCIGRFEPDTPVKDVVRDMTVAAALEDPRFSPVTPDLLENIKIEISVLTPRRKIHDISEIKIGTHGLYIKKGWYAGTLLPQVAVEHKWDAETFLYHTCTKADLTADAWKDKDTEIYVYSAIIFHEE